MNNRWSAHGLKFLILIAVFSMVLCQTARAGQWSRTPDFTIGWTAWSDAEIVSKMAVIILTRGMKYDVELTLADISMQYRGIAEGDLDVMLMSWQPKTHEAYLQRYSGKLVDLGTLYEDTSLGLVIPDYIPRSEVASIADLARPMVKERFNGSIQGIGATAGIMRLSKQAMAAYGIDYELVESSGPAMAKRLGEAIQNKSSIVVTGWRPHWMFSKYPIRYLDDPKGVFKSKESVHIVARQGFAEDFPAVSAFFKRMHFKLDELEALMVEARRTSHNDAILNWIENNREKVQFWMHGN